MSVHAFNPALTARPGLSVVPDPIDTEERTVDADIFRSVFRFYTPPEWW